MIDSTNFFPATRRKLELQDWVPLMNEQSEKRIRLDLLMPLTSQPAIGMPGFIGDAYEEMEKEGSSTVEVKLSGEIEGMTLEAYSTDSSKFPIPAETGGLELPEGELGRRVILLTGTTLRAFKLVRITRDSMEMIALKFSCTARADVALCLWAYRYHSATFWGVFTESAPELSDKPADTQLTLPKADATEQTAEKKEVAKPVPPLVVDELYEDAVRICKAAGKAAASKLQRELRIGYARAVYLIDLMEERGVVGPGADNAPRALLNGHRAKPAKPQPPKPARKASSAARAH